MGRETLDTNYTGSYFQNDIEVERGKSNTDYKRSLRNLFCSYENNFQS